ncbi:MYND-type domain-containing protein [Chloropicon primus]|uniref:MYND-type domain-containing protein n=1 Tax=Chloropicon primus TaxID=1764295 RepID=A0A5B8MS60_9CHLO|nr:hypothetical protein A3770_10p58240 [Chloropicon primus]UPR02518.1 MYND-type domain-containing protein [Chloropicon primus]|eukprot:QDZ23306.1 hypothetical protein A3770_10p58240 [Chloropicon primus]
MTPEMNDQLCALPGCGKTVKKALRCSKCKVVYYCGRDCQVKHWSNGHSKECGKTAPPKKPTPKYKSLKEIPHETVGDKLNLCREEATCWLMRNLDKIGLDYESEERAKEQNVVMVDLRCEDPLDMKQLKVENLRNEWTWKSKDDILTVMLEWGFPEDWAKPEAEGVVSVVNKIEKEGLGSAFPVPVPGFLIFVACGDYTKEGEETPADRKLPNAHTTFMIDWRGLVGMRWARKIKLGIHKKDRSEHEAVNDMEGQLSKAFGNKVPQFMTAGSQFGVQMDDNLLAAQLCMSKEYQKKLAKV